MTDSALFPAVISSLALAASASALPQVSLEQPVALTPPAATGVGRTLAADLDGDGRVEALTVPEPFPNELLIARGLGNRTFAQLVPAALQSLLSDVPVAADLDGDGDTDLVAGTGGPLGHLVALMNDGAGSFTEVIGPALSASRDYALFDNDGDGDLDVYVANDAGLHVARLDASGAWTGGLITLTNARHNIVAVHDFSGDGRGDIVCGETEYECRIVSGGTILSVRPMGTAFTSFPGFFAAYLTFADVNGDQVMDYVRVRRSIAAQSVDERVFLGGPSGFTPADLVTGSETPIAFADMDHDSQVDLLLRDDAGGLYLSHGNGLLPFPAAMPIAGDPRRVVRWASDSLIGPSQFVPAESLTDFDGDGIDDVAGVEFITPGALATDVAYGGPTGFVATAPLLSEPEQRLSVGDVLAIDLDRDGDLDLLAATKPGSDTGVVRIEQEGALRFGDDSPVGLPFGVVSELLAGDFNGDSVDEVALFRNSGVSSRFEAYEVQPGTGDLAPSFTSSEGALQHLSVLDFDADGFDDAIVRTNSGLRLFRGSPGGLLPPTTLAPGSGWTWFADLDGDGDTDLVRGRHPQMILIYENTGNGTFPTATALPGVRASEMLIFDWNLDGHQDLVIFDLGRVVVRPGNGTITGFSTETLLAGLGVSGQFGTRLRAGDLDGDGDIDVIAARATVGGESRSVAILNDTIGGMHPLVPLSRGQYAQGSTIADLDGDGDLDVVQALDDLRLYLVENALVPRTGVTVCGPSALNSVGQRGDLDVYGAPDANGPPLRLVATSLPPNIFGIFAGSPNVTAPTPLSSSSGLLCLGAGLGRYQRPMEILRSDAAGTFALEVSPSDLRSGGSIVHATAGLSWTFQAWHRDVSVTGGTSNLTTAVTVTFE